MKKKCLLFFPIVALLISAQAQTWDGSASTDWNTAANWSTNAVPSASGNVVIPGSLANYPVLASNVSIGSINLQTGSQMDFAGFTLTVTPSVSNFSYFTGTTLNNSNAATDIIINIAAGPGYNTYVRNVTVNDNISFNISGDAGFYEADNTGSGSTFTGNVNINFATTSLLSCSNGDPSDYNGNFTINRTGAGTTDLFNNGGNIGGNFSFTNNTAGNSLFGAPGNRTSIAGTIDIDINDTTPGSFELIRLINQTTGGTINVQASRGFDVRNDTLLVNNMNITGYTGTDFGTLYNNDITGNLTIADDIDHIAGYHTYIRANQVTGNAAFTINSPTNCYEADVTGSGNHYTGDVNFTLTGTGSLFASSADTSSYDGNLTINRTGAGTTDAFNSGGIIGGNISFTNNTAGNSLFGALGNRTSIAGTIDIDINDTTPGSFELIRLINQTTGGIINVQASRGFDVRNDTLLVNNINITGYTGTDFGTLYNNDITGNLTIADDIDHIAGYHTYIRANQVTGNAAFTINSPTNCYEADVTGTGNHYTGDVNFTLTGTGSLFASSADTSSYDGNLTMNRTGAGTTDAFNSGGIIGGNFSFTNNTAGNSLFGALGNRTSIAGTIEIDINDTTPGSFELIRVVNQTTGGIINVQASRGFDVRNDTLLVSNMNITGYRGTDYGLLYNNRLTGNITIANDNTQVAGYHSYIRSNEFNGNTSFTNNSANIFYEADVTDAGNRYNGNLILVRNLGSFTIASADTSEIAGNLTLNAADLITLNNIKFNGSTDGTIEQLGTQPININKVFMEKTGAGNLTLNDTVTVATQLIFSGGIINSSPVNPLRFVDNATQTGASAQSHVNGTVIKIGNDAFSFPVGNVATLNAVAMTAPAVGSEFSAQYIKSNPSLAGYDTSIHAASVLRVSGCEYWDVRRTVGTSNVTLTFDFGAPCSDNNGFYITNPATVNITHWTGSTWEDLGNGGSTGSVSGTITTAGPVTNFSPFSFGSTDTIANPLPLSLLSFTAIKKRNAVQLNWTTENEINTSHFDLETSTPGTDFKQIVRVNAKNTPGINLYESWHYKPLQGINQYRIKMTDLDGRYRYSPVVKIDFAKDNNITVTPNPADNFIFVNNLKAGDQVLITDVSGRLISVSNAGSGNHRIDLSTLSSGTYFISVKGQNLNYNTRFIKR